MNTIPMFGEHCLARLDVRICRNCAYDENYPAVKGVFNTLCLIAFVLRDKTENRYVGLERMF